MSQTISIFNDLKRGRSLTALSALKRHKCFRLASRINELRDAGIPIKTDIVESEGKRFARYSYGR